MPDKSLEENYLNMIGIRRKRDLAISNSSDSETSYDFIVYLTGNSRFYRVEFTVSQDIESQDWQVKKATFYQSIELQFNAAILQVAFQPEHHLVSNANWPEFYIFASGTVTEDDEAGDEDDED